MTNTEALAVITKLLADVNGALATRTEQEVKELLYDRIIGLSLTRQLAPVAELVAKAWLEHSPNSPGARAAVVGQLYVVGRPEEASSVEEGGTPSPVEETSEENLAWSRKNAERTADF